MVRASKQIQNQKEFEQKVLDMRRTARVIAGGRRFSFRAAVAIGNRKGKVGVGVGKGADVSKAIEKAYNDAKKNLITVPMRDNRTIPYEVEAKFAASWVRLKPAPSGHGLIAGGPVRIIADLAGIKDISAKIISRSANKLNNARATIKALKSIS